MTDRSQAFRVIAGQLPEDFPVNSDRNDEQWIASSLPLPVETVAECMAKLGVTVEPIECVADGDDVIRFSLEQLTQQPPPEPTCPQGDYDLDAYLEHEIPLAAVEALEAEYGAVIRLRKWNDEGDENQDGAVAKHSDGRIALTGKMGRRKWKDRQQETAAPIEKRFEKPHEYNCGVYTGHAGGGLLVADFDDPIARALAASYLPRTRRVIRAPYTHASHWHYRIENTARNATDVKEFEKHVGIEVLYGKNLCVVPPSVAYVKKSNPPSFSKYRFVDDEPIRQFHEKGELLPSIRRLAAAVLIIKRFGQGRENFLFNLTGVLCRILFDAESVVEFVQPIADYLDEHAGNSGKQYAPRVPEMVERHWERKEDDESLPAFESLDDQLGSEDRMRVLTWAEGREFDRANDRGAVGRGRRGGGEENPAPAHLEAARMFVAGADDYLIDDAATVHVYREPFWEVDEEHKALRAAIRVFLTEQREALDAKRMLDLPYIQSVTKLVLEELPPLHRKCAYVVGQWAIGEDRQVTPIEKSDHVRRSDALMPDLAAEPVLGVVPSIFGRLKHPEAWQTVLGGTMVEYDPFDLRPTFVVHNDGDVGLERLLRAIHGTGCVSTPPSTFRRHHEPGKPEPGLVALDGSRVVIAHAEDPGPPPSGAVLKLITQHGQLTVRPLSQAPRLMTTSFEIFVTGMSRDSYGLLLELEQGCASLLHLDGSGLPALRERDLVRPDVAGWLMEGRMRYEAQRGLTDALRAVMTLEKVTGHSRRELMGGRVA